MFEVEKNKFDEAQFEIPNYYEREQNAHPIILYCVGCASKGKKKIGFFILEGNSLCKEHFFE